MSTWWEYVRAGLETTGMTKADLAKAVGINRSTVSNWDTKGARAESKVAIEVARAFGYSVVEALVAAGHIPEDEVDRPALVANPRTLTNDQLTAEMRRRFKEIE